MRTLMLTLSFLLLGIVASACGDAGGGGSAGNFAPPANPGPTNPINFLNSTLPSATVGQAYTTSIQSVGGTGPFQWAIIQGQLPPGIVMNPTNTSTVDFTGMPTQPGTWFFRLRLRDALGWELVADFHITASGATYWGFPATGLVVFVIDRSMEMAYTDGAPTTRLQRAQAQFITLAANLTAGMDFQVVTIGGGVNSVFAGGVPGDTTNANYAISQVNALTPSGECTMYSGLYQAIQSYGAPVRVVFLGGARGGVDNGAPGQTADPSDVLNAAPGWLAASSPNCQIECWQFSINNEVSFLFQDLAFLSNAGFFYHPS